MDCCFDVPFEMATLHRGRGAVVAFPRQLRHPAFGVACMRHDGSARFGADSRRLHSSDTVLPLLSSVLLLVLVKEAPTVRSAEEGAFEGEYEAALVFSGDVPVVVMPLLEVKGSVEEDEGVENDHLCCCGCCCWRSRDVGSKGDAEEPRVGVLSLSHIMKSRRAWYPSRLLRNVKKNGSN